MRWLREQGFVVLRFWNNDVLENIDGVMEVILKTCKAPPTSILPRKGEGRIRETKHSAQSQVFEQQ